MSRSGFFRKSRCVRLILAFLLISLPVTASAKLKRLDDILDGISNTFLIPEAHAQVPSLDPLFNSLTEQCQYSPELQAQLEEIATAVGQQRQPAVTLNPSEIFGDANARLVQNPSGDYFDIRIPIYHAEWKHTPVSGLHIFLGRDNGINIFVVEFRDEKEQAWEIFKPLMDASKEKMAADPNNMIGASTFLEDSQGVLNYGCDFSN